MDYSFYEAIYELENRVLSSTGHLQTVLAPIPVLLAVL